MGHPVGELDEPNPKRFGRVRNIGRPSIIDGVVERAGKTGPPRNERVNSIN